jgi:hypothetical protein
MKVVAVRSRIHCSTMLSTMEGSGGFNFAQINPGYMECDFKQGKSNASFIQIMDGVTYYEIKGM